MAPTLEMNHVNGKLDPELIQVQAHIWNHIFNFINSMSLKCAIQLGIPDTIQKHGKPMTLTDLVSALPIHPTKAPCVHRLMRILVHSNFFATQKIHRSHVRPEEGEDEGYVLTKSSQLLLKDNPLSVTPFLLSMLDPIMTQPWHHLCTWFGNDDKSPFSTAHGMAIWDYLGQQPKISHFFDEAMASDARLVTEFVVDQCKEVFEGLQSLVDVGGGTGTMAAAIAQAFPHVDCFVLDLPHVVAGQQDRQNLKFVGGDMFEAVPPADAILMKWILHDWSDEDCIKILKRCKEAIKGREGGKVIIIDMVMVENRNEDDDDDDESTETQLFFDMLMMVLVTGKERNEKEWAKLFFDAGFSDYKIVSILGPRSLIEVYP